jgi:hypothetical protein
MSKIDKELGTCPSLAEEANSHILIINLLRFLL